ncbi:MAG: nitroreductase family protein [Eggerthellaceae bacterium]|jgi:FMN reductase (NADPH)
MDVSEAINRRRSIRSFTGEEPDEGALKAILKAAEEAPVGMGQFENYRLTVLKNKDVLGKINECAAAIFNRPGMDAFYGAPMLVVVSTKKPAPGLENAVYSSCACIVQNMALEAVEQGVGCCHIWGAIMAAQRNENVVASLQLPDGFVPCCGIALGKTNEAFEPRDIDQNRLALNVIE